MELGQKDFEKILGRFETNLEKKIVESAEATKVELRKEIGLSRLEMNQRFDKTDKKIDGVESNLLGKIDEIKKMESEDIAVVYDDIAKIKKRLPA